MVTGSPSSLLSLLEKLAVLVVATGSLSRIRGHPRLSSKFEVALTEGFRTDAAIEFK